MVVANQVTGGEWTGVVEVIFVVIIKAVLVIGAVEGSGTYEDEYH